METKEISKEQLKYAEKQGRWLRRHNGHKVVRVNVDGGIVLVCEDCDKASVNRDA